MVIFGELKHTRKELREGKRVGLVGSPRFWTIQGQMAVSP